MTPCYDHVTVQGGPDLWFSEDPAERAQARAICGQCPAKAQCVMDGIGLPGVWGGQDNGTDPRQGRNIRFRGITPEQLSREVCAEGHVGQWRIRPSGICCDVCERVNSRRSARRAALKRKRCPQGHTGRYREQPDGKAYCLECKVIRAREYRRALGVKAGETSATSNGTGSHSACR